MGGMVSGAPAAPVLRLALVAAATLLARAPGAAGVKVRSVASGGANASVGVVAGTTASCPGSPQCSGHGSCDSRNNFCWCEPGFGGLDCAMEMPTHLSVTAIGPRDFQEALGRYKLNGMYLAENAGSDGTIRVINFVEATSGWVISEFGGPCADDVCFFGYQRIKGAPPQKGYVYGGPDYQVYIEQLVYDDAAGKPHEKTGYHLTVEYTPDPHVQGLPDLTTLNGRYVLQPRYVHEETGKFAIMPIDFKTQRTWILAGLIGVPRKWQVMETSTGASLDMYGVPTTEGTRLWRPSKDGLQVVASCADHLPQSACGPLALQCGFAKTQVSLAWVRDCCRSTCGSCELSRTACTISAAAAASFLALGENTSRRSGDHRAASRLAVAGELPPPPLSRLRGG